MACEIYEGLPLRCRMFSSPGNVTQFFIVLVIQEGVVERVEVRDEG
jgi:hypothetical protein